MNPKLSEVDKQALLLPPGDREAVPEIDPAWIAEAERRYREYKEGRVEGIPGERVFEEVRQELGGSS